MHWSSWASPPRRRREDCDDGDRSARRARRGRRAFARYEKALVTNDVAMLGELFRNDPRTLRYGIGENLYGYDGDPGLSRRALAGRADAPDRKTVITDLWPRHRRGLDAVLSRHRAGQGRPADADLGAVSRKAGASSPRMSASSTSRRRRERHELDDLPHASAAIRRRSVRRVDRPSPCRQGHPCRGTAAAARRRDRARRAGARLAARRDRDRAALQGLANAGARSAAPAGGERPGRSPARIAARWWRSLRSSD